MVTTHVTLIFHLINFSTACHIHFTTDDRFEFRLSLLTQFAINLLAIVVKFLRSKHIAVISQRHSAHSVGNSLVDKFLDA